MDTEIYIRQKFFIPKGKSPIFVENIWIVTGDESFLWVKK